MRLDDGLRRLLAGRSEQGELQAEPLDAAPAFRYALQRPASVALPLLISVRSKAGIPLASSVVELRPGDDAVIAPSLAMLAMEGYAHLKVDDRRAVERRVWSRRAFVTIEQV